MTVGVVWCSVVCLSFSLVNFKDAKDLHVPIFGALTSHWKDIVNCMCNGSKKATLSKFGA